MGLGPNFTRVAVGPDANDHPTLFINGKSSSGVKPPVEISWVESAKLANGDGEFRGMVLQAGAQPHAVGKFTSDGTDWTIRTTPDPLPEVGEWIVVSGRMPSKHAGAPPFLWSTTLQVEKAKKPGG
jgi:hypothetical protein